jgi:RNA recognition motif-containing protein
MSVPKVKIGPNTTKQLFIRNLDWSLEDWQIEENFKDLDGFVSLQVARHPDGKMKGFGFVTFESN